MRVLSDVIMPSGAAIYIHMRPAGEHLFVHDNGAAFDELARHGVTVKNMAGVRRMLAETNYDVSNEGIIHVPHVQLDDAGLIISFVADASLRAAIYMLEKAKPGVSVRLDRKLVDSLRLAYPEGRPDIRFSGRNRQHRFDFGFKVGERTVLVDAVTPDPVAVNAAIVKSMDVLNAENSAARPILVYDANDGWRSDLLNLLPIGGGECVSFDSVQGGYLLEAA